MKTKNYKAVRTLSKIFEQYGFELTDHDFEDIIKEMGQSDDLIQAMKSEIGQRPS